jgi:hypothetical protein
MSDPKRNSFGGDGANTCLADREVTEIPLLLPTWQVAALATAAQDRGLTAGEMLRNVLRDFIDGLETRRSAAVR